MSPLHSTNLSLQLPVPEIQASSVLIPQDLEKVPSHPVDSELWLKMPQAQESPDFISWDSEKVSFIYYGSGTMATGTTTLGVTCACFMRPVDSPHYVLHQQDHGIPWKTMSIYNHTTTFINYCCLDY